MGNSLQSLHVCRCSKVPKPRQLVPHCSGLSLMHDLVGPQIQETKNDSKVSGHLRHLLLPSCNPAHHQGAMARFSVNCLLLRRPRILDKCQAILISHALQLHCYRAPPCVLPQNFLWGCSTNLWPKECTENMLNCLIQSLKGLFSPKKKRSISWHVVAGTTAFVAGHLHVPFEPCKFQVGWGRSQCFEPSFEPCFELWGKESIWCLKWF